LLERLHDEVERVLPKSRCLVVGRRSEHSHLPFEQIEDARPDCGPLGGLVALLELALREGKSAALAIACDYPALSGDLIGRLATERPEASLLSPYLDDRYQPLFARYSVQLHEPLRQRLEAGELALMPFLKEHVTQRLGLTDEEVAQLADWDFPQDMLLRPL
jgi:molybdopterin-guanine dinucleotide biosynthesis protein A